MFACKERGISREKHSQLAYVLLAHDPMAFLCSLAFSNTPPLPSPPTRCWETNKSGAAPGWRLRACRGRERERERERELEDYCIEKTSEGRRAGWGERDRETRRGQAPVHCRRWMEKKSANRARGAAPSARAGPARGSARLNLKSVSAGWSPSLIAPFLSLMVVQTFKMKIVESPVSCDAGRVGGGEVRASDPDCEDVPRLDLTALTEDSNWAEPVPAYSSLQRESMDREEARLSPHAGGRLIRQLLEEDSDPMLSPRFYAYGQCQQYLDDTEVPPSPPNAHSFVSRRRSSSLGSCDDEKEELTSAQLTKRIHILKKKIHRFEEKFEDERKYRPSHSDKAANPEVLRMVNELAKLRKELKEHKLMKSEEDSPPLTRQRSNTLPKSFGSQLEKKPQQEKAAKPPVENTLEVISKKLQEKREEVNRPEDIKDMTREQIGAEKVALQKALLYYESIHGRPVTKCERQIMKPLYDRYRLVKQILCRASTIPVIEEEDGSEDDGDSRTQFPVSVRPDLSMLSFLDHMDEEAEGFVSPMDELSPSKTTTDMRLSNLHSATTQELVEELQDAREEKKRLRKNLKEFEDQFFRQNGRNVQKEDRSPLAAEYNEYKHIKAKLRLLEVLVSKRDSTKII
uniref:FAM13A-like domain-containing protein n=1 Tax=Mola mola TaxID=94237 RepID=A0A3Q3VWN1_MOLML